VTAAASIERILGAEARRLLGEANGDAAKATPWRDSDLIDGGADDRPASLEREVFEVVHAQAEHRGAAA